MVTGEIMSSVFSAVAQPVASNASELRSFLRLTCIVLSALPAVFALMTFQTQIDYNHFGRRFAVPVLIGEALIVLFAVRSGFSPSFAWSSLAKRTRVAASIWFLAMFLAAAMARADPLVARIMAVMTVLQAFFVLAVYDRMRALSAADRKALLGAMATGLAGYALMAITIGSFLWSLVDGVFPWTYFGVAVTNVRQIGFFGIPLAGLSFAMLAYTEDKPKKALWRVLLTIGLLLVCSSGGRASLLGVVVAMGGVLVLAPRKRSLKLALTGLGTFAVGALLSIMLAPDPAFGASSLLRIFEGDGGVDSYSSSRVQFWIWTAQALKEAPLFGHGQGQFAYMIHNHIGTVYNHPHNVVLQLLYEWGMVGAGAVATIVIGSLLAFPQAYRRAPKLALPSAAGFVGLATTALFDGALYYPMPVAVAAICLITITLSSHGKLPGAYASGEDIYP